MLRMSDVHTGLSSASTYTISSRVHLSSIGLEEIDSQGLDRGACDVDAHQKDSVLAAELGGDGNSRDHFARYHRQKNAVNTPARTTASAAHVNSYWR